MTTASVEVQRANDRAEIAPLLDLCRAGRVFDVQAWIAAGKPVNPPPRAPRSSRVKAPLEVAIELGFHSLVEVLLRGGAVQEPAAGYDSPISRALRMRRLDIVELLIEHGCDPASVDMAEVLGSWDPKIIEYFLARGAELVRGQPFAHAFCERVRTALRPYKELLKTRPELQEQANIALRHHCKEGAIKWVSLLLWAGADPNKPGSDTPGQEVTVEDEESAGLSALGYAALYDHYEVFNLKPVRNQLVDRRAYDYLPYLRRAQGTEVLRRLLEHGLEPNDQEGGGCSFITRFLDSLSWYGGSRRYLSPWEQKPARPNYDSEDARETMKAIHLLAKHGGRWMPKEKREIASARKSLLQMSADYTLEFVWIMSKYKSCDLPPVKELLGTPTMKAHTAPKRDRLMQFLSAWDEADNEETQKASMNPGNALPAED
jgi:hypothetical protein